MGGGSQGVLLAVYGGGGGTRGGLRGVLWGVFGGGVREGLRGVLLGVYGDVGSQGGSLGESRGSFWGSLRGEGPRGPIGGLWGGGRGGLRGVLLGVYGGRGGLRGVPEGRPAPLVAVGELHVHGVAAEHRPGAERSVDGRGVSDGLTDEHQAAQRRAAPSAVRAEVTRAVQHLWGPTHKCGARRRRGSEVGPTAPPERPITKTALHSPAHNSQPRPLSLAPPISISPAHTTPSSVHSPAHYPPPRLLSIAPPTIRSPLPIAPPTVHSHAH